MNWNALTSNSTQTRLLKQFAEGEVSGRGLYEVYKNTDNGGMVRNLLREKGVSEARRLARKALDRRFAKS
jgi:hypothetical protein